jgi:hypothetical protein
MHTRPKRSNSNGSEGRSPRRTRLLLRIAALGASSVLASSLLAGALLAGPADAATHYHFRTLGDANDTTFNQLLGINNEGVIAGYFGSGAQNHPNKGYVLFPQYYLNYFADENYPNSVQTQVTAINDGGLYVGFWSDQDTANMSNDNFGFYKARGKFHNVNFPTNNNSNPPVNQLLGVNDSSIAVGFYNDSGGNSHGYKYNINTHHFAALVLPNTVTSDTAAAINNRGDIAGFATIGGNTEGFLLHNGHFKTLSVPGSASTQAFGVNDSDEVVGQFMLGSGNNAKTHGFTWKNGHFTTVDDPNGIDTTTVNGVNDLGQLVGFYTDSAGNTDGMLATP